MPGLPLTDIGDEDTVPEPNAGGPDNEWVLPLRISTNYDPKDPQHCYKLWGASDEAIIKETEKQTAYASQAIAVTTFAELQDKVSVQIVCDYDLIFTWASSYRDNLNLDTRLKVHI